MVTDRKKDSAKGPVKQEAEDVAPEPNKINASTPYDFAVKNLTPYGGLLPVITMLEKLGFQALVEQTITSTRIPRAMDLYRFVLGLYIGFPRLNQLRFIARDPILTGILKVTKLPVQSTFWRFVNGLHLNVARQILAITRTMRERVWAAANVKLEAVTLDTDTTVHTIYGQQMGGRKSYNPKNKGKKSYQPDPEGTPTFIAETREYLWGELHNGDRPTGKQIGDHIRNACAALPPGVKQIYGRVGPRGRPGVLLPGSSLARLMKNAMPGSRSRRVKLRGWSRNCVRPSGSRRPRRTAMRSASSAISRMGGARHTGSWHCAMRKRARR